MDVWNKLLKELRGRDLVCGREVEFLSFRWGQQKPNSAGFWNRILDQLFQFQTKNHDFVGILLCFGLLVITRLNILQKISGQPGQRKMPSKGMCRGFFRPGIGTTHGELPTQRPQNNGLILSGEK